MPDNLSGNTGFFRNEQILLNQAKVRRDSYDFPFAVYLANKTFISELQRTFTEISLNNGKFTTVDGKVFDTSTIGGQLALSGYQQQLLQAKETFDGLAQAGLQNEKKLWQLQ